MKRRPVSSALFVRRADVLGKLEAYFSERDPCHLQRREFLLYGIGGGGKTQLALRFAEENQNR